MIELTDISYGPEACNRLEQASDPSPTGALAMLESFYYALNNRDIAALRADWTGHPLAQLNNPVGGILRGGDLIAELYEKIFAGSLAVTVTFGDVVAYVGVDHAVFAGRERGHYLSRDGARTPLEIRTSRYFRYADDRWSQYHHHGSIDDADALRAYQRAVRG